MSPWTTDGWIEDGTRGIDYVGERKSSKKRNLGCIASALFILLIPLAGGYYGGYFVTNEPNPLKWSEINRKKQEENRRRQELYEEALKLAESHDGGPGISFADMVNLYKRMGINGPFYEERGISQFPTIGNIVSGKIPTIGQLEQAITSYEAEKANR